MSLKYFVYDVFTDRPLTGNALAVVEGAQDLDGPSLQAIAREFNLSETVFILPPRDARHRARLRIFTPTLEMPFAGHPTLGASIHLALSDALETPEAFGLEVEVGPISAIAERKGERLGAGRFRAPRAPVSAPGGLSVAEAADALGLAATAIGFGDHKPSRRDCGPVFDLVPVASLEALAQARPTAAFETLLGPTGAAFLYAPAGDALRARMFAPGMGVLEDPATGSACVCLAGALAEFEQLADGTYDYLIDQGVEMGRPSRIQLHLHVKSGGADAVEIAGSAVRVAEGALHL